MSEEGQKGQNKVDFDSADIGKKQKAVQFTEIEGAEERAKAAEKAKTAAEKAAEELHEANVEAVAERQVAVGKAGIAQAVAEREQHIHLFLIVVAITNLHTFAVNNLASVTTAVKTWVKLIHKGHW